MYVSPTSNSSFLEYEYFINNFPEKQNDKKKEMTEAKNLHNVVSHCRLNVQKPDKPLTTPPTVDGEQIKKKSEQVAIGQILNQAAAIQDRISTKEHQLNESIIPKPATNSSLPEAPLKQNIAAPPKTTAKQSPEPVVD